MPSEVPITPPWKLIPPSHSFRMSSGLVEVIGQIVEQDIAEPAAEDDPERGVEDEVVGMAAGHRRAGLLQQFEQIPIAEEDAGEIGEAVPAQLEEAEVERDRRQAEVGKGDAAAAMVSDGHSSHALHGASPCRCRLIGWARQKAKEWMMAVATSTGSMTRCWPRSPGRADGSSSSEDEQGRAIVANFPATLPAFFKTFCALNGAVEAVIAGDERLTFADLDALSDQRGARRWSRAASPRATASASRCATARPGS